jgi:biotin carboxyl carrier protein
VIRKVLVNGREVVLPPEGADVSVEEVEPDVYSVLLDGSSFEAVVDGSFVIVDGQRFAVEVQDPRAPVRTQHSRGTDGRQTVCAPMPGKVVRILVAEGDHVEAGQGIAVVEAMKMQNEMKSPKAGRVVSLTAREGAAVVAGEALAAIE